MSAHPSLILATGEERALCLANALMEIADCANQRELDANLRAAWIGYRAAEALDAHNGDYASALLNQRKAAVVGDLIRAHQAALGEAKTSYQSRRHRRG